jgi:hypothetical protein
MSPRGWKRRTAKAKGPEGIHCLTAAATILPKRFGTGAGSGHIVTMLYCVVRAVRGGDDVR